MRMIQRRIAILLILFASLVASVGRCAPAEGGSRSGPIEIEFWTLALSPWFDAYLTERIAAFEEQNPGVKVRWVDVPYTALERKLIASAAAGRSPDVVNMPDLSFARFVSLGAFRDIAPLAAGFSDELASERYIEGGLNLCLMADDQGNPRLMGLPWYLTPQASLINTGLLKEGGLDAATLPLRWTELIQLAPAFHEKTGKFLVSQPLGTESQLLIMMLGEGISPVRAKSGGGLVGVLSEEPAKGYIKRWIDLYRSGAMPRAAATDGHAHLIELYQGGELALVSTGPSFLRRIASEAPAVFERTAIRHGAVGKLNRVHDPIMVLGVMSGSRHPVEAAKLAWFMTGPESQTAFCKLAPIMPSSRRSLDDPFFQTFRGGTGSTVEEKTEIAREVSVRSLPTAVGFTPALPCWPDMRRVFEDGIKHVLLDGADLDTTLKQIDREWDVILSSVPSATMSAVPLPGPAPER